MNGAQVIVQALKREGVDTVFGYPGGAIMPVYDALLGSGIRHILVRHEQAAVHAAEGYAQASGKVGVCITTSGPGATNIVTGLADAYLDGVPVVALCGQVATSLLGTDAFQEVNMLGITMPVVKHGFLADSPQDLDRQLWQAFRIAESGRPGPVLVDLPKDIQLAKCETTEPEEWESPDWDEDAVAMAALAIHAAKRPLILAGGGVIRSGALAAFRRLTTRLGAPVVCTLKGLGALPTGHPQLLGMVGMHGAPRANLALATCDLLLALGTRFSDRVTGNLATFCPRARVLHFDIEPAEISKRRKADMAVTGPLQNTLSALMDMVPIGRTWTVDGPTPYAEWSAASPSPFEICANVDADIITTDVGQHQIWAAQHVRFQDGMTFLTSGGLGTMGYGLPAAIGAQLAHPDARVVCLTGDGSLMMMVQELATVRRYRLPIKIILFENGCLGMVRQWQEVFFDNRESEIDLSDNPDFLAMAAVFGIPGRRLRRNADVHGAMAEALESSGPFLLHCEIERQAAVWPLVPPGKANHEMLLDPLLDPPERMAQAL